MSTKRPGIVVRNVEREVSDDELDELERRLGYPLPAAYRRFVKRANGGTLDYDLPLERDGHRVLAERRESPQPESGVRPDEFAGGHPILQLRASLLRREDIGHEAFNPRRHDS